jgi:hypothetical protein
MDKQLASVFDLVLVEYPNRLKDVKDPCTEKYYPSWSARGMRAVRCTRNGTATLFTEGREPRRVCITHAKRYERLNSAPWKVTRD